MQEPDLCGFVGKHNCHLERELGTCPYTFFFCAIQMYCSQLIILFNIEIGFLGGLCLLKMYVYIYICSICIYILHFILQTVCFSLIPLHVSFGWFCGHTLGWFYSCLKTGSRHFEGNWSPGTRKQEALALGYSSSHAAKPFLFNFLRVCLRIF